MSHNKEGKRKISLIDRKRMDSVRAKEESIKKKNKESHES